MAGNRSAPPPAPVAPAVLALAWNGGDIRRVADSDVGDGEVYVRQRLHAEALEAVRALLRVLPAHEEDGDGPVARARRLGVSALMRAEATGAGGKKTLLVNLNCE